MRSKRALQSFDDFPKAAIQAKRGESRVIGQTYEIFKL